MFVKRIKFEYDETKSNKSTRMKIDETFVFLLVAEFWTYTVVNAVYLEELITQYVLHT